MRRPDLSGPIIFALAVSLAALVLTLAALILLATILSQPLSSINPLIITSATLHALSASMMLRACWRENARWKAGNSSQQTSLERRSDASAASVLAISGHATTLALLAWTLNDMYQTSNGASTESPYPVVYTLVGFWILALLSQIVFFWTFLSKRFAKRNVRPRLLMSLPAHWPNPQNSRVFAPSPHQQQQQQQQQQPQRQLSQRQQPQRCGPSRHIRRLSAGWATAALESLRMQKAASAFRFNMAKRSDSAEPLRPGIIRGAAGSSPSPRRSHDSAFDFWDTSAVSTELRQSANAEASTEPYARAGSKSKERDQRRLPTIPGSRSGSPARPLDGPFTRTNKKVVMEDEPMLPPSPRDVQEPITAASLENTPSKPLPALPMILPMYRSSIPHHASLDSMDSMDGRLALHQSRLRKSRPTLLIAASTQAPSVTSIDSFTAPSNPSRRNSPRNLSPGNASLDFNSSTEHLPTEHHHHHFPIEPDPTEAHIHPLFRTNSPTPPPAASANTVVTAAPVLLSDIPLAVVRASADRIRDARGLSLASSSSRCSPANSPPLSPSFLSSPLNPNSGGVGATSTAAAGGVGASGAGRSSRPHSRHDSRTSSRSHSRAASRASNRNAIVLRGPAGTVPPTPTSPTFPMVAPPSPVVAVGPGGKVVTRDDLVRTGNFIVFE